MTLTYRSWLEKTCLVLYLVGEIVSRNEKLSIMTSQNDTDLFGFMSGKYSEESEHVLLCLKCIGEIVSRNAGSSVLDIGFSCFENDVWSLSEMPTGKNPLIPPSLSKSSANWVEYK